VYEQISANKRKTVLLIFLFVLLLSAVGLAVDYFLRGGVVGIVIVAIIVTVSSFVSYFNSDKVALRMAHAQPADPVEYARYHNLVEGLCIASGLPKPRLYIVDDSAPNAFSTGRNPKHAAIAVTTGLLDKMNRVELEGVLAHELSHIKNYDILVTTIAVTAVGTIALISDIGLRFAFWGGMSDRRDSNSDSGPIGAVIAIASLAILMLAPFAGYLMQMAMSRNREYLADASGVQLTRFAPGLISALEKLRDDQAVVHYATKATAQMWIEQPLETDENKQGSKFNKLFDTHPPLEDRIKRLQEM
jgi:heat shock protein HtpX